MRKSILVFFIALCLSASGQNLPDEYRTVDSSGDGYIQVDEIQTVIDGFFTSEGAYSVEFIHYLIDYFFIQDTVEEE